MANDFNMLDTNATIRIFINDIPEQHKKVVALISDKQRQFFISDIVFFEVVYILSSDVYKFNREQIQDFIRRILTIDNIKANSSLIISALKHFAACPKLSFADCYLVEFARINHYEPLWTFDRKLAVQSGVAKELK